MATERETTKAFRVESMNDDQFSAHCINLQAPMAQLNPNNKDYNSLKRILQFGIEWRSESADNLRHTAQLRITAASAEGEFTAAYKASRLVKLRLNLCKARELYLYASIAATDGWEAALEILGESFETSMTEEQKKKLEGIRKKKLGEEEKPSKTSSVSSSQPSTSPSIQDALLLAKFLQAQASGSSNMLSLLPQTVAPQPNQHLLSLTGPKKKVSGGGSGRVINKTGTQCFRCEGFGHWSEDDICPINILAKSHGFVQGKRKRTDGE